MNRFILITFVSLIAISNGYGQLTGKYQKPYVRPFSPIISPTPIRIPKLYDPMNSMSPNQLYSLAQREIMSGDTVNAMKYYRKSAVKGHAGAQYALGRSLVLGEGIKKDTKKGWRWIEKAAKQGDAIAMYEYGKVLYYNEYDTPFSHDDVQGLVWMERAAESAVIDAQIAVGDIYFQQGDTANAIKYYTMSDNYSRQNPTEIMKRSMQSEIAQVDANLGCLYYDDLANRKKTQIAMSYWKQAVLYGHEGAAFCVGANLLTGDFVEQDIPQGIAYMRFAIDSGLTDDMIPEWEAYIGDCYWLGTGVEQDTLAAVRWYREAAEAGYAGAQLMLANYYTYDAFDNDSVIYWGEKAECRDSSLAQYLVGYAYYYKNEYRTAETLLKKAAEKKMAEACWLLSYLYCEEEMNDSCASFEYTRRAADLGYADAIYEMGCYYLKGEFVKKDIEKAIDYFKRAAEAGIALAYFNLGVCHYWKEYGRKDRKKAASYWNLGAEMNPELNGTADCQYSYGMVLKKGSGVKKDREAAIYWLKRAAKNGSEDAKAVLKKMHIKLDYEQEQLQEPEAKKKTAS